MMRTEYLRYFELCYVLRSFTAAAKRIPMSRQGLVKAMRALEGSLGVTLFDVDEDSLALTPTPYADALVEFAHVYGLHEKRLMGTFDHLRAAERRIVRVGASFGITGFLGEGFDAAFSAAHPDITLTFVDAVDSECDRMLMAGEVDIALLVAPYPVGCTVTEVLRGERLDLGEHGEPSLGEGLPHGA